MILGHQTTNKIWFYYLFDFGSRDSKNIRSGSALVLTDPDVGFASTICRKNPRGAESGNTVVWATRDTYLKFREWYAKGPNNLRDAESTGRFKEVFEVDMDKLVQDSAQTRKKYNTIYIIHPCYWDSEDPEEEKPTDDSYYQKTEEERAAEELKKLTAINEEFIKANLKSASLMINPYGFIKVLMKEPPYDSWGVESIADGCGLKLDGKIPFDPTEYLQYKPRMGRTDEKIDPHGSFFYCFCLKPEPADSLKKTKKEKKANKKNEEKKSPTKKEKKKKH